MKLLVLGGSDFVGRAVVAEALGRGDQVTVFNRGRQPAPPGVTALLGDRSLPIRDEGSRLPDDGDGFRQLARGEWDVVVDTWSAAPFAVRDTARLLAGRTGSYAYISSRSVYRWPAPAYLDESAPVLEGSPDAGADGEQVEYGKAKRGGELAALAGFGERALLVRAGLILGPYENVGRLPWWLRRIAAGGRVLAPGPADLDLQYIDARDLAIWTLDAAGRGLGGAYNLVSPPGHTTMGELLTTCVQVTGSDAELRWLDPEPILAAGVEPWTDLPIWIPPGEDHGGMHRGDVSRALGAGLRCRPIAATVADTWGWLRSLPGDPPQRPDRPPVGLDPAVEAKLLAG